MNKKPNHTSNVDLSEYKHPLYLFSPDIILISFCINEMSCSLYKYLCVSDEKYFANFENFHPARRIQLI